MMRRTRVSVELAWSLNWLWCANHVYSGQDYRPSMPGYVREQWAYTRPRDTPDEAALAEWRAWRRALWAQITRHHTPDTELTGCDPPRFTSLAHAPAVRAQLARDWDTFQDWWAAAETDLAGALRSPEIAAALAQTDPTMPADHAFTIFVVGLRQPQTLAESHQHPHGNHHAVVSVGMLTDTQRFADWLQPTVTEIARHNP